MRLVSSLECMNARLTALTGKVRWLAERPAVSHRAGDALVSAAVKAHVLPEAALGLGCGFAF